MLLVFISTANAALIETDLVPGSGDGLLTLDTDTNLEWLDLTETINLSFNEISGGAGGYTTILGFRYATHEEVTALYLTAGVTEFGLVQLPSNIPAAEQLLDLMGCITVCSGTLFGANGLTSTSFAPNTHSNPFFQLDTAVGARFWIEPNGVTDDSSSPFQGNYLVREAVLDGPPLLTVFPDSGGNTGPVTVTVTIRGDVFMDGASVALESVGFPSIEGEAVGVEDQGSSLVTTFDLTGQSEGLWDVVVTNPDGTVFTLPEGFTIEAGIGAQLWAEIIAPPVIRAGQSAQFFVAYGNKGNVDATYPWLAIALPSDIEYSVSAPNAWPPSVSDAAFPSDDTLELTLVQLPPLPPGSSEMMTVKIGPSPGANTIPIMVNITTDATSFFEAERTLAGKVAPALVGVDTTGLDVVDYNCDYQEEVYNPVGNVFPAGTMFMWSTPPDVLKDLKIEFNIPDDELADWLATNDCPSKYFDRALDDGKKCFGWHVAKSIGCGQFVDMLSDGDADGGITVRTLDDNWLNHQGIFQTRPSSLDSEAHRTEVRETALASYKVFGISDDRDHYTGGICESDYTPENGLTTNCLGLFYILNPELADENINVPADIFGMPGYQNPEFLSWLSGKIEKAESKCPNALKELEDGRYIEITVVTSIDPNDKYGPAGYAPVRHTAGDHDLAYTIRFENLAAATAPAQEVIITDQLDVERMHLTTFSLGPISFGDNVITPPSGLSNYTTDVDLRPDNDLIVRVAANLDVNTGMLEWRFSSIDPATGLPTTDPLAGFLPPNLNPPEGDGSVLFTVMPKDELPTGTEIRNAGSIVFDTNTPIQTPEWLNTLDNDEPSSAVVPIDSTQNTASFTVEWAGTDVGAGIKDYTVWVSEDGGEFTPWLTNTADTSATFSGVNEKMYGFYSIARDQTGNTETPPTIADTSTTVSVPVLLGDFNGDSCLSKADYNILMADIRSAAEPKDLEHDLNGDGMVNRADARTLVGLFTNPRGAACN